MTKDQANEIKVGVVVLICLGLGLGVALKLSNWRQWLEPTNTLTFKVPYQAGIGGIKPGWPVSIGGVEVGSVEKIWLCLETIDPEEQEKSQTEQVESDTEEGKENNKKQEDMVEGLETVTESAGMRTYSYFRFTVPRKYKLREDCKLVPASQLIGGAGELTISDLGEGELLQDGQVVFSDKLEDTDLGTMKARAEKLMDKAKDAMEQIQKVITRAKDAMEDVNKITGDFKDVSSKAKETVSQAKPKLEKILANIEESTQDVKDISGKTRETVDLTKPQLEKIIANVRAASEEMKQGMREIRWNPWRLLHDPTDRELRTQNLLTAARAFSSGASDLDAAADKLEGLIEARQGEIASDDPDLAEIIEQLKVTITKFSEAEETFFKRLGKAK